MKEIWTTAWAKYKEEWKALWNEYKTLIGPFIIGTAKYIWQLFYGLLKLVGTGVYESGKYIVNVFLDLLEKA